MPQPQLQTDRLRLRPFTLEDVLRVKELAGDKRIADVTASIPHPYREEDARGWIQTHPEKWRNKELASFAIVLRETGTIIGAISLMDMTETTGEVGYWIGVDYWGNGYATEACREVIDFGFRRLHLRKITARHLHRNPASGRVLTKSGFAHVGSREPMEMYKRMNTIDTRGVLYIQ